MDSWPTAEEVGNIVALAIADNDFLSSMLTAAEKAGDKMLPGDIEKLVGWAELMKALRGSLNGQTSKKNLSVMLARLFLKKLVSTTV